MRDDAPPGFTSRATALNHWRVDFCFAITLLAAPLGPSAMCFLRHARGFGWLDPFFSRASGVSSGYNGGSAARMGQRRRAAPTLHTKTLCRAIAVAASL